MHWRFTMVAASTVFVLGGDQIVSRVILVSSPTVIYAVLMVILFLVLALFVPRYEPGPGGRLKSFSEESGTKWFTIDDVMRNSKIRTLRMTRRELAYNLMKLYDMGELEMGGDVAPEISGREVEQVVTLRFRKPPGQ